MLKLNKQSRLALSQQREPAGPGRKRLRHSRRLRKGNL